MDGGNEFSVQYSNYSSSRSHFEQGDGRTVSRKLFSQPLMNKYWGRNSAEGFQRSTFAKMASMNDFASPCNRQRAIKWFCPSVYYRQTTSGSRAEDEMHGRWHSFGGHYRNDFSFISEEYREIKIIFWEHVQNDIFFSI